MGNSCDNHSVFEGFTGDDLIKVDGDLDIDFDAMLSDNTSDNEASDEQGDTLLTLSTKSWTQGTRLQDVQEVDFIEDFGPFHKLPVDSKPAHNYELFFGNETFKLNADIEITDCKK